ncbi:hypothetical protein EXIGLDRAFT_338446 [Exidia glandulosa HHB12029]|uniref:Uncharacterized protein n=1 Tax=Exidia glandulosa HHB12029 TaxID=1314781 RepID=A0A165CKB6_EXIGL|nr:hypothetical protein EXIGLDRAFT_338446 [Exidia glandulosa HHB12029]
MLKCLHAVDDPLVLLNAHRHHRAVMDAVILTVNGGGGDVCMMSGGIVDAGAYGQFPWALHKGITVDGWGRGLGRRWKERTCSLVRILMKVHSSRWWSGLLHQENASLLRLLSRARPSSVSY